MLGAPPSGGTDFNDHLGTVFPDHLHLRRRLGRISKRGDVYLRMLLIHGARSVLWHAKRMKSRDRLRAWALRLEKKLGHNKAAVALANKLARITWAVWKNDRSFEPVPELQAA